MCTARRSYNMSRIKGKDTKPEMQPLYFVAHVVFSFFCFAKRKKQRKGDFFPKAPPEKKGSTLLAQFARPLHGAGFDATQCFYLALSIVCG